MKRAAVIGFLVGMALAVGLVAYQGVGDIGRLLVGVGWGVLLISAVHLVPVLATTLSWRSLLVPAGASRPLHRLFWMRWVGDSINALLPAAQVGGEVVRGLMLRRLGVPGPLCGASVIIDLTAALLSLILFIALGGALLLARGGGDVPAVELVASLAVFAAALALVVAAQRYGWLLALARRLEAMASGRAWQAMTGGAAALDRAMAEMYRRPASVARCIGWRFASWLLGAAEIWLSLWLLGHPVGFGAALIIDALGQAARNLGFAIPGQLGVQEGGYLAAGLLVGVPADTGLAVALIKRVRDVILGVPALLIWQWQTGRRIFAAAPVDADPAKGTSAPGHAGQPRGESG